MTATTAYQSDLIPKLQAARRVGTPIAAINTPDQPALVALLAEALNGKSAMLAWDYVRGLHGRNDLGVTALQEIGGDDAVAQTQMNPITPLSLALRLKRGSVLFYINAQRFVADAGVCQALMNLRDEFKADGRMVVLVGTGIQLPAEIAADVVQWTEPLPTDEQLLQIVSEQVATASEQFTKKPTAEQVKQAAIALRSCSAFGAEQFAAMSLRKDGIDQETLHTQAKALIEKTPGLTFEHGKETFANVGGLEFAKEFGSRKFKGPKAPAVVVRVEELEKAMAGSKGDLSGTSGDALQVLLSGMEDNDWSGMLAFGCPGAGKSLFAKSLANTYGAKAISFDINACKGSLVGQSEQQIRRAMDVIKAIGGDRVFFVASVNALDTLPAALQRRFRSGTWFFDLPTAEERQAIWALQRAKYKIAADDPTPDEDDLSGADIRNICEQAYDLGCTLAEARRFVVPLKVQAPRDIAQARELAKGRFTDASRGGVYGAATVQGKAQGRKVQVG